MFLERATAADRLCPPTGPCYQNSVWFLWLLMGLFLVVMWLWVNNPTLCPSCGTELPTSWGAPDEPADHCVNCGWHRR